ncbi:MAG: SRPBCC domain-containing protein [Nocardioides sp.]|uniref:SRPBCC family protein n=1 Tax=Nocardioides sp. TaxID=35761 RepID=UPI003F0BF511
MPVTHVEKDLDNLTITITAEFAAPVERVWQVYADPRQLEKWWGPEGYPATVTTHEFRPGGRVDYAMTGPDGATYPGWWRIDEVDEPHRFVYTDGFSDADGKPIEDKMVNTTTTELTSTADGTRVTSVSRYGSAADLQQVLEMGVEEGATSAINQIDALVAA